MYSQVKSKETLENTQETTKTLSDSISKSNSQQNSKENIQYPEYFKKSKDKNRFQKCLKKLNNNTQSEKQQRKKNHKLRNKFYVEEIREEEEEIQEKKQKKIRPKLRIVMDNEFMKRKSNNNNNIRSRSLEQRYKKFNEKELPSIIEEQEQQINMNKQTQLKHIELQFYDKNEFNNKFKQQKLFQQQNKNFYSQITQQLKHLQENIDENQEISYYLNDSQESNSDSQFQSSKSKDSRYSLKQNQKMERSKSCHSMKKFQNFYVDEIEQKSQRDSHKKKNRTNVFLQDQVIQEEEDIKNEYDVKQHKIVTELLSNERVYLKKIMKGEMISSNLNDNNILYKLKKKNVKPIDEIQDSEDSNKESSSDKL